MRKVFLTILTLTFSTILSFAQIDWGAKAGLNYNFGGDFKEVPQGIVNSFENAIIGADDKAGFHVGLWTKIDLSGLYIRPEIVYTELNNSYESGIDNFNTDFKTRKIDVPLLIGAELFGPLHIFGGPSFQFISESNFDGEEIRNISTRDFTAGLQLGAGLEFGRLGVDVRWEKGFNNDLDGEFLNTGINVDNRPNQIIFGLSYQFNNRRK